MEGGGGGGEGGAIHSRNKTFLLTVDVSTGLEEVDGFGHYGGF